MALTLYMFTKIHRLPHCKILVFAKLTVMTSLSAMAVINLWLSEHIHFKWLSFLHNHFFFFVAGVAAVVVSIQLIKLFRILFVHEHYTPQVKVIVPEPAHISINVDSIVIKWDSEAEKLFGFPSRYAVGRSLLDLIVPNDMQQAHLDGIRKYLAMGRLSKPYYEVPAVDASLNRFNVKIDLSVNRTINHVTFDASVWRTEYPAQEG